MLLFLIALFSILFLVHQFWYRRRGLPPGPTPLPFVGNVHSLWNQDRWETKLQEWKEQYGPVYTYWMGPMAIVSVNDYAKVVEFFVRDGDNFVDRMPLEVFANATRGGVYGIVDTSGGLWREQRRFALRVLRDFGLGKNKMQERILEEVQTICENINRDIDSGLEEHDFHKHTDMASGSVINAIVAGYRFSTNGKEREFYGLRDVSEKFMKSISDPILNMGISSEFLLKFPPIKRRFEVAVDLFNVFMRFMDERIEEHIQQNDYSTDIEPRDFIDAYLIEMHRCEERGEPHHFSKIQLRSVAGDLWFAGQETTSSTLNWGTALMCRHPEVQAKLHEELDRVIGSSRLVTLSDKHNLPFTQAVIMEIQRYANIVVQNLLRKTSRDIEIDGYTIRKDTVVIPQISTIMIDPKTFDDPSKFSPARFIDADGKFCPAEQVIPFSIGKRQCLGEGLARMELYLFVVNFFNQYKFSSGREPPTLKKSSGGASFNTQPYKCRVERRF